MHGLRWHSYTSAPYTRSPIQMSTQVVNVVEVGKK